MSVESTKEKFLTEKTEAVIGYLRGTMLKNVRDLFLANKPKNRKINVNID